MSSSAKTDATEALARFVSGLQFEAIPDDQFSYVGKSLLDWVGCCLAGFVTKSAMSENDAAHQISGVGGRRPYRECLPTKMAVDTRAQPVSAPVHQISDPAVQHQESLRRRCSAKSLHLPLFLSRRSMRRFAPVV